MSHPIMKATLDLGQSLWLDYISRELMDSGGLERHVAEGLRGMTSNPTIFEKAVAGSEDYDDDIRKGIASELTANEVFENLAVSDVARACNMLSGVYQDSKTIDGYVSLEVSPTLAHDTKGTVTEALRLWERVNRPNLMIKVPGTVEGQPAILELLTRGINVNVTLLFTFQQYVDVLETYIKALEARHAKGEDLSRIASVASFFVSRIDTVADAQLEKKGRKDLCSKGAIANACMAYKHFQTVTASPRWKKLADAGAQVQRPLWASTSTKNPAYPDTLYVDELIAQHTVNTVPPQTLSAFKDHGKPAANLLKNMESAEKTLTEMKSLGVDIDQIAFDLIEDGVVKFAKSYDDLISAIASKLKAGATA
ncbi:MAG: transaldolase [Calditrichaeota bacterium]|nr:transaldolase [Calditrichota bacterium]MCB9368865.1 transaldolase [Calditrichota bacterium]